MTTSPSETTLTIEGEGITVTMLVWRMLRRQPAGYVERVLERNPGIADAGVFLPVGMKVVMPLAIEDDKAKRTVIRLWD